MLKNKIFTVKSENDDYFKLFEIIDIFNKEERKVYQGKINEIGGDVILVENLKTKKEELYSKADKNKNIFKQWIPGRTPHVFNLVDFKLPNSNHWVEGIITKISQDSKEILIKYINKNRLKQNNEEWININSNRISKIGTYTKNKKDKIILTTKEINEKLYKNREFITLTNDQENNIKNKMEQNDYKIIPIIKDGNCLFRAISHQIYGDDKYHSILREKCMDYIKIEKNFFEQFIEGDFDEYINIKRKNGIWGDDIEIQALSEIYNRPIEIYSGV